MPSFLCRSAGRVFAILPSLPRAWPITLCCSSLPSTMGPNLLLSPIDRSCCARFLWPAGCHCWPLSSADQRSPLQPLVPPCDRDTVAQILDIIGAVVIFWKIGCNSQSPSTWNDRHLMDRVRVRQEGGYQACPASA